MPYWYMTKFINKYTNMGYDMMYWYNMPYWYMTKFINKYTNMGYDMLYWYKYNL
jgi:hypothetical protein